MRVAGGPRAVGPLEVRVARGGHRRLDRTRRQRRAAQIRVQDHARRVQHAPQRRPRTRGRPVARASGEVDLIHRTREQLGTPLGQHRPRGSERDRPRCVDRGGQHIDRWQVTQAHKPQRNLPPWPSRTRTRRRICPLRQSSAPMIRAGSRTRASRSRRCTRARAFLPENLDLGYPGEYPFTRGVQASMYRGDRGRCASTPVTRRAEESNARYRYLLEHGQTGLSVAFDLPTQMGLRRATIAMAEGEVGKVPVFRSAR